MKKVILLIGIVALSSTLFTGCSKDEDTEAPVITLSGSNPLILTSIGDSYVEPGFEASDNEDGTITARVVVDDSNLNEDSTGTYEIQYSVSDDAGNSSSATREVIVKNAADVLKGTYAVLIQQAGSTNYNYSEAIGVSATINNRIIFGKFGDYANSQNKVYANVTQAGGSFITIQIPTQTVNCGTPAADRTFSGTGSISVSGGVTTFVISVTESIVGSSPITSTYTYTK
jgi:hypothetical protein